MAAYSVYARRCRPTDKAFIFGLVKTLLFPLVEKYFRPDKEMFEKRFALDYKERHVLMRGKRRIGFCQLSPDGKILFVTGIFLKPAYQRKGLGGLLMKNFETFGFKRIRLRIWENNPARGFYEKLGYSVTAKDGHKYLMEKYIA